MYSFFKFVAKKTYNTITSFKQAENGAVAVKPVCASINRYKVVEEENVSEAHLNTVEEDEEGCIYAYGTVSLVHNSYVLIENKYMCETKYVVPADLKKGDRVRYMAYKANKGEDINVRKILSKAGPDWEKEIGAQDGETEPDWFEDDVLPTQGKSVDYPKEIYEDDTELINAPAPRPEFKVARKMKIYKKQLCKRVHVGKVEKRSGRSIYLEDGTKVNLDEVSSDFLPVVGDWVQLDCLVTMSEDVMNFKGEIVEIEAIKPHRTYNKIGKITVLNEEGQYGIIDKSIVFNKFVCLDGYLPCIGDKVIVQSIESDQGVEKTSWRALSIVPITDVPNKFETSAVKYEPQLPCDQMKELLEDKENIEITKDIHITLNMKEEKTIEVMVKNNGNFKQIITKCAFLARRRESQLSLIDHDNNEPVTLRPECEVMFVFRCKGRFIGVCKELVIFKFNNFKIGRIFEITVNSVNTINAPQRDCMFSTYKNGEGSKTVVPKVFEDGMYIKGVKPYKPAKFIPVRPVTWKIPPVLWSTIDLIIQEKKTRKESEIALQDKIPCLNHPLSYNNYKQRFNYLLYLEEIAMVLDMRRFSMDDAVLHRNGEYLTLNVPGLAEKRPSLIIGDRVIVYFKWQNGI